MTRRPLVLATIALLVLGACSSDDDSASTESTGGAADAVPTSTTPPSTSASTAPATTDTATTDSTEPTSSDGVDTTDTTGTTDTTDTLDSIDPGTSDTPTTEPDATDVADVEAPPTIEELLALGRPIVLAHAGGEDVHPHSTPFAYAESVAAGVDMLDFDVQLTADDVLVVHHDDTVDRTTNSTGAVADLTYDELRELDNAYWFTPECVCKDRPEIDYIHRGVRTGDRDEPPGYGDADFVIPRLRDIVERFPTMPLNIEIKAMGEAGLETARVLADELAQLDRLEHSVVTSFDDAVNDEFQRLAPEVEISPGLGAASGWVLDRAPLPDGMRILQLPPEFQGIEVLTAEVIADSIAAGYPIWVWPNDRELEDAAGYARFLEMGIVGLNANDPEVAVEAVRTFAGIVPSPFADAIAGAEAALAEGDSLGDCPYGPTSELVAALPADLPLAPGFGTEGVEENGQVFHGGDVDIVYCALRPDNGGDGPIDEIRVDVAPTSDVDVATYLDEEFTSDEVELDQAGDLLGGTLSSGCWDDADACGAFWQGDGIFIATVLMGEDSQDPADAQTVAETLVPIVIERLAATAT